MPASRSRSKSPRRSSSSSYSKDKSAKPNSRELITIKTEKEDFDEKKSASSSSNNATNSSRPKTYSSSEKDEKSGEKTYRKPSESPASKGSTNWNSSSTRPKERKFTGRCRLFVGNLVSCDEAELKEMFEKYGEVAETFVNNDKGFGFVRLDTRLNAEAAKQGVDGTFRMGRTLRVRFATHASALKVVNLNPMVTNELLHQAFSQFGDVERAVVVCDDRGRSKGYGIVEFSRKNNAQTAVQQVNEGLFLLGRTPCPVSVKQVEHEEDEDGISDENLKRNPDFQKERECAPHFVAPNTFEADWAQRWRALEEVEVSQKEALDIQFKEARDKLESEMAQAIQEHETMLMRQELQRRQDELHRMEEKRQRDEIMRQAEMRRQEERRLQEELRRREEELRHKEELFRQQQHELQRHRQEDMMWQGPSGGMGGGMDWEMGYGGPGRGGPGPGMRPPGMMNPPRMGPGSGMMPFRGHPPMGGPRLGGPRGPPVGPGMRPTLRPRFENKREYSRERVDEDRLAARSRQPPGREHGDAKRFRH
ncbi:non-POU domain-containing octamer-binding protein-like isoform X2 [Montipora capricornis]|uniref:non-POU domain-containing octamer-binding protein-like isoform X2 n=1 Tax=Montipora capricornis TaxID=246305 RepID=UPI0035F12285